MRGAGCRVRSEKGFFNLLSILKTRSLQNKELVGGRCLKLV